jgi:dihydroorotase
MHVHFREGEMLRQVAPLTSKTFAGAVIMPNTQPPIDSKTRLDTYRREIEQAAQSTSFKPYITIFFTSFSEKDLLELKPFIIGLKLYPAGITTGSDTGVHSIRDTKETLGLLEEMQIPLLVHGETGGFVLDRETEFLPFYEDLAIKFPALKIIMEHITTRKAVSFLDRHENLYATITLHHLLLTLDDVIGQKFCPHLFCKPIAKRPEDREALQKVAFRAHPKVMFGSDSAPHPRYQKECRTGAAGIFTAPVALQILTELFEKNHALENLQAFVSNNARRIYAISPPQKTVILEKKDDQIPEIFGAVVPFKAGETVSWRIADVQV